MQIEILDPDLRAIAGNPDWKPERWSDDAVQEARRLLNCADAALAVSDLTSMRVLGLEPSSDGISGEFLARCGTKSLTIEFKADKPPVTAIFDVAQEGAQ